MTALPQLRDYPWPANVEHITKGERKNRYYPTPDGEFISITTMLKAVVAKGDGITNWVGWGERKHCLGIAAELPNWGATPAERLKRLKSAVGSQLWWRQSIKESADIGTDIHDCATRRLNLELGIPCEMPRPTGPAKIGFDAWQRRWDQSGLTPLRMEQVVWHAGFQVGGRGDLFAWCPRRGLGYVDYKSSSGIYDEMHLQATFYREAACFLGIPVEWAEIWKLPKYEKDGLETKVVQAGERFGGRTLDHDQMLRALQGVVDYWDVMCAGNDN